ncbi:unnamed protein product [Didymodactylos carnosus]|uniref:Uncharacterized protein n=1 Tax=Didymodactylos carnosus TaxID=1234261 RepID=A0A815K9V4_9BILA|nr:unnamed protein product [Didymodactylos carnosus]CAF4287223.1 unnamed protein product [Didymodactylos carnosus]
MCFNVVQLVETVFLRNDLPPETVYKNELNRKKRFENHLAILKSHKTHNSFPTALSAMPHPTIGSDSEEFVKEWNDILNQYRHKLMDITTQYLNDTLDETKEENPVSATTIIQQPDTSLSSVNKRSPPTQQQEQQKQISSNSTSTYYRNRRRYFPSYYYNNYYYDDNYRYNDSYPYRFNSYNYRSSPNYSRYNNNNYFYNQQQRRRQSQIQSVFTDCFFRW